MPYFSIIVPVFNRPDEVDELLQSLSLQENKDFELILVEDGSIVPCKSVVDKYLHEIDIHYYTKPNSGRSETRNYGMERATGDYFVFFDSDCIIPPAYFSTLQKRLETEYSDCFGGPDNAHESFSDMQKAINYAMTSFFTTGGIRGGGKRQMEKFKPRTFNMGFSRSVYEKVGGFKDMFGEDIDLALRIQAAYFRIVLFQDVFVYHKRRVNLEKFFKQVRIFGTARVNLALLHKDSLKVVHAFPTVFLIGIILLIVLSIVWTPLFILPLVFYTFLLFVDAWIKTKKLKIALLSIVASYIQLVGYGYGFLNSFIQKIIFRKGLESHETLKKVYK